MMSNVLENNLAKRIVSDEWKKKLFWPGWKSATFVKPKSQFNKKTLIYLKKKRKGGTTQCKNESMKISIF